MHDIGSVNDRREITGGVGPRGTGITKRPVSIGLIVTEGVINALKHAFRQGATDGRIVVAYETSGPDWKLSIADNGVGKPSNGSAVAKAGLGTSIVSALAEQLDAHVDVVSGSSGTTVLVVHASSPATLPRAA